MILKSQQNCWSNGPPMRSYSKMTMSKIPIGNFRTYILVLYIYTSLALGTHVIPQAKEERDWFDCCCFFFFFFFGLFVICHRYKTDSHEHEQKGVVRNGELSVVGAYSVKLPDGYTQTTMYVADKNGYRPQVQLRFADINLLKSAIG